MPPAATLFMPHVCPMVDVIIPHVGGPIMGPGVPNVIIGEMPASVMGDMLICVGPPDTVLLGAPNVLIGGRPAAFMGSLTAHGGVVMMGDPLVEIL